jgi:hypothetical protein
MPSCEYCWNRRWLFDDDYYKAMADAEQRKAPCTTATPEGEKARAGQFWDEERQCDTRKCDASPNGADK